jgi:uncharacterized Ntn-hydrolase superfamily protein
MAKNDQLTLPNRGRDPGIATPRSGEHNAAPPRPAPVIRTPYLVPRTPLPFGTFSLVARDAATGDLGVAVASKFLAVGAVVPWARAGVGAVATQAHANVAYGPEGLRLMDEGFSAPDAVAWLIANDAQAAVRQCGMVDAHGRAAAHTGAECMPWAGHEVGDGFACQGNILTGREVVTAMAEAYRRHGGPFPARLLEALAAGEAAGGDSRGKESAALLVVRAGAGYGGGNDRWIDLRVDDHPAPVAELMRLLELHRLYFPHDDAADTVPLAGETLREVAAHLQALGYLEPGQGDAARVDAALTRFAGVANLEERLRDDGTIDATVLAYLRERAAGAPGGEAAGPETAPA